jgi:hypothetical protein
MLEISWLLFINGAFEEKREIREKLSTQREQCRQYGPSPRQNKLNQI